MEPVGKRGQREEEGLTVSELMDALAALPPDEMIWIDVDGEYFYKISKIALVNDLVVME